MGLGMQQCNTTVLLDPFQDAITGSSARVCMVAAVHPAHPVETAPGPSMALAVAPFSWDDDKG